MKEKATVACSLVINVSVGDTPILEQTLPHILDTHNVQFGEVLIAIDQKPPEGRILQNNVQYSHEDLLNALETVRQRGYQFKEHNVSYTHEDVQQTYARWFAHTLDQYRCAGGTPIYVFLYGLELAQYDYRLHLDADMLIYDPQPKSWINKAIDLLEESPDILFVNQTWGPQTDASPSPPSIPTVDLGYGQRVSQVFSSRCFLYSMQKLEALFLPIEASKYPLHKQVIYAMQNRSPYRALEHMIGIALNKQDKYRADLDMSWGFNLHAWNKRVFDNPQIGSIIRQIEQGNIPDTHIGQHNLDYDLFDNVTHYS